MNSEIRLLHVEDEPDLAELIGSFLRRDDPQFDIETALEFGGLDREAVLGKKMWDAYWFQHSERTRERAKIAVERAADGEFVRHELPVQGRHGEVIIDFSVRPVTDDQGGGEFSHSRGSRQHRSVTG